METKTCTVCKNVQPLYNFYARKAAKDGRQSKCKGCTSSTVKKSVAKKAAEQAAIEELSRAPVPRAAGGMTRIEFFKSLINTALAEARDEDPLFVTLANFTASVNKLTMDAVRSDPGLFYFNANADTQYVPSLNRFVDTTSDPVSEQPAEPALCVVQVADPPAKKAPRQAKPKAAKTETVVKIRANSLPKPDIQRVLHDLPNIARDCPDGQALPVALVYGAVVLPAKEIGCWEVNGDLLRYEGEGHTYSKTVDAAAEDLIRPIGDAILGMSKTDFAVRTAGLSTREVDALDEMKRIFQIGYGGALCDTTSIFSGNTAPLTDEQYQAAIKAGQAHHERS